MHKAFCLIYQNIFTANVGGLLSLCLGISVLSLVELIYYLTLKIFIVSYIHFKKQHKRKEKEKCTKNVIPFTR